MSIQQRRSTTCFTKELQESIVTIALDKYPNVVGSYSYVAHPYPGDIDLFEAYQESGSPRVASQKIAKKFQDIAKRIQSRKNTYLKDFKAGEDERYKIDWTSSSEQIVQRLMQLLHQGLLTKQDLDGFSDLELWKERIRDKYILRWKLDELLKGFKRLPGGKTITLSEALRQQTIVKIDIITLVNDYYTEITNFFKLTSKESSTKAVWLSQPFTDYEESLKKDLQTFSDPSLQKHLKLAKRFWNYSVLTNDSKTLYKLKPLLDSGATRLAQVESLIETILFLIERLHIFPKASNQQIQRLNFAIGSIPHKILPERQTKKICKWILQLDESQKPKLFVQTLKKIQQVIHRATETYAYRYLEQHGLLRKIKKIIRN